MTRATVDVLALPLTTWQDGAELHGREIMQRTRRSGPTVYTVLDRLEDAGWVGASWEILPPGERRTARMFHLSRSSARGPVHPVDVVAPMVDRIVRVELAAGDARQAGLLQRSP